MVSESVATTVEKFFTPYRTQHFAKGHILILNDTQADDVFYLMEGKVKQYDVSYKGDEVIVNVFKPYAFFPMSLAITKEPSAYIYEAETDITIKRAPSSAVVEFIKTHPDVLFDLLTRVYSGLDGLLGRMAHLMMGNAKARLMFELLLEARRFGTETSRGSKVIAINEQELAARAGLARETVSRELMKLCEDGLVSHKNGTVTILNVKTFESRLGTVV